MWEKVQKILAWIVAAAAALFAIFETVSKEQAEKDLAKAVRGKADEQIKAAEVQATAVLNEKVPELAHEAEQEAQHTTLAGFLNGVADQRGGK